MSFLLGCDYIRDKDGVLRQEPKKYIEKMIETYERLFGEKPRKATSPLVKGDHPELDTSELLDDDGTRIYQSMIGAAQWIIQLGRFDIAVHVMTLSSFRAQPRVGHLERMKRVAEELKEVITKAASHTFSTPYLKLPYPHANSRKM